ncbi:kinase-like domain-containing protein [Phaeosphaeriaceae sp. PMI808]|nr:kinase-like domain-containing protein [Phaeosphaeriaceae sp. PMI808]
MDIISNGGRTSTVYRVKQGLALKSPRTSNCLPEQLLAQFKNVFTVERQLLERLGHHPRIVRYYGLLTTGEGMKDGLLLDEANRGDLESYIDSHEIDDALRRTWSLQIAEAVAYVHKKGIIHSNLSTANILVHQADQSINLLLADFGGSRCSDLSLDGGLAPDFPFYDPHSDINTERIDVFSLGILLYIINTGQYPFHEGPAPQDEERFEYGLRVRQLYEEGKFPDLRGVQFGEVISGCCVERRFPTAEEVVAALKVEM